MYDSLLDELEDDVVATPGEVEDLAGKSVEADDDVDAGMLVDGDESAMADGDSDGDASGDADEVLVEQSENWSDDPVRMYLTQMGEIPLLTRAQEIHLARQIETTRAAFRAKLMECEFVCNYAFKVLSRVHRGELPFDRTVQVSVTVEDEHWEFEFQADGKVEVQVFVSEGEIEDETGLTSFIEEHVVEGGEEEFEDDDEEDDDEEDEDEEDEEDDDEA